MNNYRSPQFTVIIPARNAQDHIGDTLGSVLQQRFADFEVIVVDDASSDRTGEIVLEYAEKDPRIRLVSLEHCSGGPAIPRNRGIHEARGEYVAFLDADDLWLEGKLLHDAQFLAEAQADIIFSGCQYFADSPSRVLFTQRQSDIDRHFLFRNCVPFLTVVASRSVFSDGKLLFDPDPHLVGIEDYHFLLCAYLNGNRIVRRPGVDALYRMNSSGSIYRRDDFGFLYRRLVYNWAKLGVKHSLRLRTLLYVLSAGTLFFSAKKVLGRL